MKSSEIEEKLEALKDASADNIQEKALTRFLVFSVGDSMYALKPEAVKEIIRDFEIFPLPSCPSYIPGLINNHGLPYAVFDLNVLFNGEHLDSGQFLILNVPGDAVSFRCSEVKEIAEVPADSIFFFAEKNDETTYFSATFQFSDQRIPVISVSEILKKLEKDLV